MGNWVTFSWEEPLPYGVSVLQIPVEPVYPTWSVQVPKPLGLVNPQSYSNPLKCKADPFGIIPHNNGPCKDCIQETHQCASDPHVHSMNECMTTKNGTIVTDEQRLTQMYEQVAQYNSAVANIEYGAEYKHDGKTWSITYFAKDEGDARQKLKSLAESVAFLGQLADRIPADKDNITEWTSVSGVHRYTGREL